MALSVTHPTVASGTDAGDGTISKNAWNQAHTLTATEGRLLGAPGSPVPSTTVGEITVGDGLSLESSTLAVDVITADQVTVTL